MGNLLVTNVAFFLDRNLLVTNEYFLTFSKIVFGWKSVGDQCSFFLFNESKTKKQAFEK